MPNPYRPGHRTNQMVPFLHGFASRKPAMVRARRRAIRKHQRLGRSGMTRAVQTERYFTQGTAGGRFTWFRKLLGW